MVLMIFSVLSVRCDLSDKCEGPDDSYPSLAVRSVTATGHVPCLVVVPLVGDNSVDALASRLTRPTSGLHLIGGADATLFLLGVERFEEFGLIVVQFVVTIHQAQIVPVVVDPLADRR